MRTSTFSMGTPASMASGHVRQPFSGRFDSFGPRSWRAPSRPWQEWSEAGRADAWVSPQVTAWRCDEARRDPARRPRSLPGSQASKRAPVVIVSNDGGSATEDRLWPDVVTVVPVTSYVADIEPFQVMFPVGETGLGVDSKAQAEEVRPIEVERLGARIGHLTTGLGLRLDQALRLHLG